MSAAFHIAAVIAATVLGLFLLNQLTDQMAGWASRKARKKRKAMEKPPHSPRAHGQHEWKPKFHLKHEGMWVYNLPFTPDPKEVFYIERNHDEAANAFVRQHQERIRERFATKGLTFVYLPDVRVPYGQARAMVAYHSPEGCKEPEPREWVDGLPSNFLLNYMVFPRNKAFIKSAFAWYGYDKYLFGYKKKGQVFNLIVFNGQEALAHPEEVLAEILEEVGESHSFEQGVYSKATDPQQQPADAKFDDEQALDEETRQMLEQLRGQLDQVRLRGISEAVIARYLRPAPKLSHLTVTHDLRIILDDYQHMEILMEPIVKTVFLFFLRHPGGMPFKQLPAWRREMEAVYRSVKQRRNDIDRTLDSGWPLKISPAVAALCDPTNNSINEKCSRVKAAFVSRFHDTIASHYYIIGTRSWNKLIALPREMVTWE